MKIVVIGGGPSGMMAAIKASKKHEVILLERNNSLGKKLLVTGNRRCNITNNKQNHELVKMIENGRFMYSTFSVYSVDFIKEFFSKNNLPLIEESQNKMYPHTEKSIDVLNVLRRTLNDNLVDVRLNSYASNIIFENSKVKSVVVNDEEISCDHLIIATGGKSFPKLGSDGNMHKILSKNGVKITPLYPCEVSLISSDKIIKKHELVGLTLENVEIKVVSNKKTYFKATDSIIFTHKGISGPGALNSAQHVYKAQINQKPVFISIKLIKDLNQNQFTELLNQNLSVRIDKFINRFIQKRLTDFILNELDIDKLTNISQISNRKLEALFDLLFRFNIEIKGTDSLERAFVTGGGVSLQDIDSKTYQHRDISNLSIAGELLDLHGPIGGYNLTIAFLSGAMAGSSI